MAIDTAAMHHALAVQRQNGRDADRAKQMALQDLADVKRNRVHGCAEEEDAGEGGKLMQRRYSL